MKVSEKWLREWINPKIDSSTLYDQIINSGLEIERIDKFEPIFSGIVVGKIVKCTPHSQLNKLKIVKLDIGSKKLLNIVCGASNCRDGIKVAVATIGAILPNKLIINIKNLKGELSEGMLCSFFELGLFKNDEIIEFSEEVSIGTDVSDYLSLKDNIIKINATPNRPDGLSILGISRNIVFFNNLVFPSIEYKSYPSFVKEKFKIQIKAKKECTSYIGRIIKDININAITPFWMKKKLFLCDIISEDIITDIINFVLIELGQPINILNADNIDSSIIIRMADDKEEIILKNNIKIPLSKETLVFSDASKILSIPGNINSYILDANKDTKNIFLSTCLINKKSIFHILKKVSSNKILDCYNYGIDPLFQRYAIEYATHLIIQICGGTYGPISDETINSSLYVYNTIRLHYKHLKKVVGILIDKFIISNILYNLDYKFIFREDFWDVISPSWRFDILIEEDVINDIMCRYGYNNICLTPLKESLLNTNEKNRSNDFLLEKSRFVLVNKGYYEAINYGFINPKVHDIMFHDQEKLLISNPISKDMSCMRLSLWPGLLKIVSYNKNRQQENIRFFESGLCFSVDKKHNLGIKQELFLGAVISGNYSSENWYSKTRKVDFYDLKGDLESVLEALYGLNHIHFKRSLISGLHPEQSASIYFKNNFIGSIGAVDPRIEKKLNINRSTFLFEISLNNFFNTQALKIKEVSKFPISRRDISILILDNIAVSDVLNECKKIFTDKKVEINLFDVYSCQEFSHRKNSLGISFIFQDEEKTFTETEINLMMDYCIGALNKKFQVTLRK